MKTLTAIMFSDLAFAVTISGKADTETLTETTDLLLMDSDEDVMDAMSSFFNNQYISGWFNDVKNEEEEVEIATLLDQYNMYTDTNDDDDYFICLWLRSHE